MSPVIVASIISACGVLSSAGLALTGVLITTRRQTARIDVDNQAALAAQTAQIKQHLADGAPR